MSKTNLIIGTYNHLPEGTSETVLEDTYRASYRPFLATLYRFPEIPASLHYSGTLLSWLDIRHPEFIMLLKEMMNKKQVELLGGGFYEPIFPILPISDRLGQIEHLTTYIRKKFGKRPRGCWLPEYAWEQSLVTNLQTCGIDYVFLTDTHFLASGLPRNSILGPCITEDQGRSIAVIPVHQSLSESLPHSPGDFLDNLPHPREADAGSLVSLMFKGELSRPSSADEAGAAKAIESFLEALRERVLEIEISSPTLFLKQWKPKRKGYLTNYASDRMLFASLTQDEQKKFSERKKNAAKRTDFERYDNPGSNRQFLLRFAESGRLYAKMQYVHLLVNQLKGDKSRKKSAREELWKGQCGNAFWHGDEKGICNKAIRSTCYFSFIEAEKAARETGVFLPSILSVDYDFDGENEYLFQGNEMNAYIHPRGGTLIELDLLSKSLNLLDTFSRYKDYSAETEQSAAAYDELDRPSFIDRFFILRPNLEALRTNSFKEAATFRDMLYQERDLDRNHQVLVLKKEGLVKTEKSFGHLIALEKTYILKKSTLDLSYSIKNLAATGTNFFFSTELNFSIKGNEEFTCSLPEDGGADTTISEGGMQALAKKSFSIRQGEIPVKLLVSGNTEFDLALFPVISTMGPCGITLRQIQGWSAFLFWKLELDASEEKKIGLSLSVKTGSK